MKHLSLLALAASVILPPILASAAPAEPPKTRTPLQWERTDDTVALRSGSRVVWQFNYGTNESKPFFHPLALNGGPVLTWDKPGDHRWHRALWFSWKYINGLNYWEEDKNGLAQGRTEVRDARVKTSRDGSATIELDVAYRPATEKEPALTERRTIRVSAPAADGSYYMDWAMTFKAGKQDALLNRTPLPGEPGGQVFGGYAGLSIRFANELQDVRAITTDGAVEFTNNRFRGKSIGLDYSGIINGQEVGVAILDHPANLNSPSPWYVINDKVLRFFTPAVICYQPHTIKAGESLKLNYRVVVHPGRWAPDQIVSEQARFSKRK
jgi:hypothetical protein